eukprot:COSAG05_NODE_32_length_28165_cov_450.666714_11_plen_111_part_00
MLTFLADTRSELTQALDMVLDDSGVMGALGNPRCKRFALVRDCCLSLPRFRNLAVCVTILKTLLTRHQVIEDGIVKAVNCSEAPGDPAGDNEPEGAVTALTRVDAMIALC